LGRDARSARRLAENTEAALKQTGISAEVEKVTAVAEIAKFGVMFTPALAIDGEVKVAGKVPTADKIAELLSAAG